MNLWFSMLIPVIALNGVFRFVQFLFDRERYDKTLVVIILTVLQLICLAIIVMVVNEMTVTQFLFWTAIVIVFLNYLQTAIDNRDTGLRMGYGTSFAVVTLIGTLVMVSLFWFLVV